jgi:hypothetical protein
MQPFQQPAMNIIEAAIGHDDDMIAGPDLGRQK